jgi:YHS domain-containing protein
MGFFSRILRFLFWVLVLSWGINLLRRAVAWMLRGGVAQSAANSAGIPAGAEAGVAGRRLVRDPVCGLHVAEAMAIPLNESGEVVHFCSTACRDRYIASTKKFAANAG